MKKIFIMFIFIVCGIFFAIDSYGMESKINEEDNYSLYEMATSSELIHYSDELSEDYLVKFVYNELEYSFSFLDFYFCNNKNDKYSGVADVYSNFDIEKDFNVVKMSYISTGVNKYVVRCYVYIPNMNKLVYFQMLTNYYLSEIIEFYETYDYNQILIKNSSIFNYVKSQINASKVRSSTTEVEKIVAEYSKEAFLTTTEFIYGYLPLHSNSSEGIGGYVRDDSIVDIIPKEYFLRSGVKCKYGREWGFYLNVETVSSDQKECTLVVFRIKMEKPTNQSYIAIEFIPLFQQEYIVLSDSENNRIWFDGLFYGSYKGSYVVSDDYSPGYSFSDFSLNSYFTNLETYNEEDTGYIFEEDTSPRVDSVTCGVLNYRSSHEGNNSASSRDQAVVGHYLNAITDLAWSEAVAYFGSTVKVLELADYIMNHVENLADFAEKMTIVETLSSQYNVYSYESLNQDGTVSSYTRDISIKFSTNGVKKIYIGESWDNELSDSMEKFSTNIHLLGQGAQKSFQTIAVNLNKLDNRQYSVFSTLIFSNELVYNLTNTEYFGNIASYQNTLSLKPVDVLSFVPTRTGVHVLENNNGDSMSYVIYDSSYGSLTSSYITRTKSQSMTYLESGKVYYIYVYSNLNACISFSLNYYNSYNSTYTGNDLNKTIPAYGCWIIIVSVEEFRYYTITTSGFADTKICIFKDDYMVDYNDDYYESSDDEDTNLNACCYQKLVVDSYYILVYNNESVSVNVTFSFY